MTCISFRGNRSVTLTRFVSNRFCILLSLATFFSLVRYFAIFVSFPTSRLLSARKSPRAFFVNLHRNSTQACSYREFWLVTQNTAGSKCELTRTHRTPENIRLRRSAALIASSSSLIPGTQSMIELCPDTSATNAKAARMYSCIKNRELEHAVKASRGHTSIRVTYGNWGNISITTIFSAMKERNTTKATCNARSLSVQSLWTKYQGIRTLILSSLISPSATGIV